MEEPSPPALISDVQFAGAESNSQGSVASRYNNDSMVRFYLATGSQQNADNLEQARHSLVIFDDSASSPEGSMGDKKAGASTLLTV